MSDTNNIVVWAEIPVKDLDAAKAFYSKVFGFEFNERNDGPNAMADFYRGDPASSAVRGHLYVGEAAGNGSGPTLHLAAETALEEAMERVAPAGGKVVSPIVTIPVGRFAYCTDPDGNSIGIFTA